MIFLAIALGAGARHRDCQMDPTIQVHQLHVYIALRSVLIVLSKVAKISDDLRITLRDPKNIFLEIAHRVDFQIKT